MNQGAPNLSIILPGGCNASCSFCYWERKQEPSDYLDRLRDAVRSLPPEYRRVTLTGGEPTLSPYLRDAVDVLRSEREWDAVVLATNGALLGRYLDLAVDHVNLSRHHHHWNVNEKLFGVRVIDVKSATWIGGFLNKRGIDLTINCVLCDQFHGKGEILGFVRSARDSGASAVTFRADQRNETTGRPRELEWLRDWETQDQWSCEACRVWRQTVYGMPVYWKASIPEPSVKHRCEYELIFHQDARLTLDWAGDLEKVGDMIRVVRDGVTFECDTVEEALGIAGGADKQKKKEQLEKEYSIGNLRVKNPIGQGDITLESFSGGCQAGGGLGRCNGGGMC